MLMGVDPRSLTHFQRGRWASSGVHGCNGVFTCSEAFHKIVGKALWFQFGNRIPSLHSIWLCIYIARPLVSSCIGKLWTIQYSYHIQLYLCHPYSFGKLWTIQYSYHIQLYLCHPYIFGKLWTVLLFRIVFKRVPNRSITAQMGSYNSNYKQPVWFDIWLSALQH